jgi:hypothetical protein
VVVHLHCQHALQELVLFGEEADILQQALLLQVVLVLHVSDFLLQLRYLPLQFFHLPIVLPALVLVEC